MKVITGRFVTCLGKVKRAQESCQEFPGSLRHLDAELKELGPREADNGKSHEC